MNRILEGNAEIRQVVESLIGQPIDRLAPSATGANSAIYCAEAGRHRYAVKTYRPHIADGAERTAREWRALTFLHGNGITSLPRPIGQDAAARILVMEWIEGAPVTGVSGADMGAAVGFIREVVAQSSHDAAAGFGPAAEACLSTAEIVRQVARRREAFTSLPALDRFLNDVFDPLFERVRHAGPSYDPLEERFRRLVPADFGFHNALRTSTGALRFFDLDYFGWDDPVKLTADFMLHPAMALTVDQQTGFAHTLAAMLLEDRRFPARLQAALPLFALRWALIVLNVFRRERWAEAAAPSSGLLDAQLTKAVALCDRVKGGFFPVSRQ